MTSLSCEDDDSCRETRETRQSSTVVGLQTGCPVRGPDWSDPAGSGRLSGKRGLGGGGSMEDEQEG